MLAEARVGTLAKLQNMGIAAADLANADTLGLLTTIVEEEPNRGEFTIAVLELGDKKKGTNQFY